MLRAFAPLVWTVAIAIPVAIAPPAAIADDGDASAPSEQASPVGLGGFAVGDGVEAMIGEADGSLSFALPLGPVTLAWDSRSPAEDRYGLGERWRLDAALVDDRGGVRVASASGGVFEADASAPSGLSGYALADVRFERAAPDALPARDGAGEWAPAWSLFELGGTATHFSESGEPVAQVSATGQRTDWVWDPDQRHRLTRVIDAEGIVTELEWRRGSLTVTAGVSLVSPRVWRVELGEHGPARVVDPVGQVSELAYTGGLVSSISGPSGGVAQVSWHAAADGVARVACVAVLAPDGTELSARTWRSVGATAPSGWPALGGGVPAPGMVGGPTQTELSDGALRVRAEYDGLGRLVARLVSVMTASGEHEFQWQAFEYRHAASRVPTSGAESVAWSKPVGSTLTHVDPSGATRSVKESFEFDELGRLVRHVAGDGAVSTTEYDAVPGGTPDAWRPPVGMPVRQTVSAPDGSTTVTEHELNASRTAVLATRTSRGIPGAMVATAWAEYEVEPDGFVTRAWTHPGGDPAATPLVTSRQRRIDRTAGTVTVTESVSAGGLGLPPVSSTASLVHGGTLATVDGAGRRVTATYDAIGRVIEQVDASGRSVRIAYESAREHGRNATVVTGPDGVVSTEVRDELGRVVEVSDNIRAGVATPGQVRVAERREYPAPGTVRVIDAFGQVTTTTQDVFGRAARTELPTGLVHVTEHDDITGVTRSGLTPTGRLADAEQVAIQRRDESGRVIEATAERADEAATPTVQTTFDGFGRAIATDDGRRRIEVGFDAQGRPETTSMTELDGPLQMVERRRFDAFGQSLEKQREDGATDLSGGTRVTDALGRVASETDRFGMTTSFEYDVDGQVTRSIDSTGTESRVEYDADRGRPVRMSTTAPGLRPVTTEIDYDDVTGLPTRVRDLYDPQSELSYAYDAFGNVLETRYPDGTVIRRTYDEHGRPATLTDAAGLVTVYEYDRHGTLAAAVQRRDGIDGPVVAEVRYRYDAYGRVDRLERGNGVSTSYTFTSAGQIASETTTDRDGHTTAIREYEYDPYGALTRRIDRTRDRGDRPLCETATEYRYDALDRLRGSTVTTASCHGAGEQTVRSTSYEVTTAGDLTRRSVEGHIAAGAPDRSVRTFEYTPAGELVAIDDDGVRRTQRFDARGQLAQGVDGTRYAYDAAGRVIEQTDPTGGATSTTYWADGTRRALSAEDVETRFYWDEGRLLNDRHTTGSRAEAASYLLGSSRHARILTTRGAGPARSAYYDADRHGSVAGLTDAAGDTVATYRYGDYGEPHTDEPAHDGVGDASRNPFGYAGEYTDPDGSQPLGDRVYDAGLARFRTPDRAPQFNRFAYANLNPITKLDPTGRTAQDDADHWALLGLGIAVAVATAVFEIVTAGTTAAMIAAVVAGAVDAGLQLIQGVNEKREFMPGQLGVVIGVAAVAATIGLSMYMKRTTLLPNKVKPKADVTSDQGTDDRGGAGSVIVSSAPPGGQSQGTAVTDPVKIYVPFESRKSITAPRRAYFRSGRTAVALHTLIVENLAKNWRHARQFDRVVVPVLEGSISKGSVDLTIFRQLHDLGSGVVQDALTFRRLAFVPVTKRGFWVALSAGHLSGLPRLPAGVVTHIMNYYLTGRGDVPLGWDGMEVHAIVAAAYRNLVTMYSSAVRREATGIPSELPSAVAAEALQSYRGIDELFIFDTTYKSIFPGAY